MSIESVMPSNHLTLCFPLLLLPSIFPRIRVFSNKSVHHFKWPKYWIFSLSISPSNEYSGLISFRIDWFDLLEIQGMLWKGKKQVMVHISCCQRRIDGSRLCCKMIQCILRSTMKMTPGVSYLQYKIYCLFLQSCLDGFNNRQKTWVSITMHHDFQENVQKDDKEWREHLEVDCWWRLPTRLAGFLCCLDGEQKQKSY